MKLRLAYLSALGAASFTLISCGEKAEPQAAEAPGAATAEAKPEPAEKPAKPADPEPAKVAPPAPKGFMTDTPPVDIGGFGTDEPHEAENMHQRGILTFSGDEGVHSTQQHWEQFDWEGFEAKRWGRYHVRLTYTMRMSTLPMQFKIADQRLKKTLKAAHDPEKSYLGTIYLAEAGAFPFSLYTSAKGVSSGIDIHEVALIPAPEGEPVAQNGEAAITLPASSATTWSEMMRYEPKPEKQCLGFWVNQDDFAEWEFDVVTPGRYTVSVTQGCGEGQGGSEVAILSGDQRLAFTVADTGGFQNWKDIPVGEITFDAAGPHKLAVNPVNKTGKAVLDIQKLVLTPVN